MNTEAPRAVRLGMLISRSGRKTRLTAAPRRSLLAVVLLALAVAAAACSSAAVSPPRAAAKPTVSLESASIGSVLAGPTGLTLYAFSAESPSDIVCQAGCTSIWPPLTVAGGAKLAAGSGLTGTLATVTRPDGTHQVTYNGLLLYTYAGDSAPGQTKGQGLVEQYGSVKGTWSAVTPGSRAASASGSTPPSTTAPSANNAGTSSTTTTPAPKSTGTTVAPSPKPTSPPTTAATTTSPSTSAPTTTAPPPTTTTTYYYGY